MTKYFQIISIWDHCAKHLIRLPSLKHCVLVTSTFLLRSIYCSIYVLLKPLSLSLSPFLTFSGPSNILRCFNFSLLWERFSLGKEQVCHTNLNCLISCDKKPFLCQYLEGFTVNIYLKYMKNPFVCALRQKISIT